MERVQSLRHRVSAENMTNGTLVLMNEKPDSEQVSELFQKAISLIVGGDYVKAREVLRESTAIDMENPEAYNLLGISYEMEGDRLKAARFYRVAYYIDQTFAAAAANLDRISDFRYKDFSNISWGA